MINLFIDIETVGSPTDELQEIISGGIKAPANWKDKAKIDAYVEEKAAEAMDKLAISACASEITTICFAKNDGQIVRMVRTGDKTEKELLTEFWSMIEVLAGHTILPVMWIGYNVMFDYEFLRLRSIINGVKPTINMPVVKQWDKSLYDVKAKFWGESVPVSGFKQSLDNTSKLLGLSGKYEGISGAEAPKMWLDGEYERLVNYCAQDVELTREIYKRINYLDSVVLAEGKKAA